MKKITFIITFFLIVDFVNAQEYHSFREQINFTKYLLKNHLTDDCITLLKNELSYENYSTEQKDSINNFLGHAYYNINNFDSAAIYFGSVSPSIQSFSESIYLSAYSFSMLKNYIKGIEQLKKIDTSKVKEKEFRDLQLSGIYLLSRDTSGFSRVSKTFTFSYNDFNEQENKIIKLNNEIKNIKPKSGFLAGLLSAMIPGLGKVYAGKVGQGVSSFIPVTLMGLSAYETYKKAGIKSSRFIIMSSLFSIFYIGNIWGSALSVSVCRNEKNNEIDNQILFNLRIPLQKFIGIYQ